MQIANLSGREEVLNRLPFQAADGILGPVDCYLASGPVARSICSCVTRLR